MMRLLRSAALVSAAIVALACSSVTVPTAAPTGAPITTPTTELPPTPTIELPPTPPINGPSVAPGGGFCALVTEAEMSAIVGSSMSVSSNDSSGCFYNPPSFVPTIVIRSSPDETIEIGKLITTNGRDLTIGGNRAYYGEFSGALLYIEKGGRTLVIQAVWSLTGDELVQKVSQIGEIAIARF